MQINYFADYLEIVERPIICGLKFPPTIICTAKKLGDILEEIFDKLSDWDEDNIYYFFMDLETPVKAPLQQE